MIKYLAIFTLLFNLSFALTFQEAKKVEKQEGVTEAIPLYKKLVEEENKEAIYTLAMIYAKGKGVKRNIKQTYKLLLKGYELGDIKAAYSLAKLMLNKKTPYFDEIEAYNIFVDLSMQDYAPAYNMLGKMLVKGIVVEKNYKLAVKYFERASKQNYTEAHCNLAYMYASGKGVFPNFGRAHTFAKEGMKKNHPYCKKIYKEYNLKKYPVDNGWKFNFYTNPNE